MAFSKKGIFQVSSVFLFLCVYAGIYLFLIYINKAPKTNDAIPDAVSVANDSLVTAHLYTEVLDMENISDERVTTEKAFSGKQSSLLSNKIEYGIAFSKKLQDIPEFQNALLLIAEAQVFAEDKIKDAVIVLTIDSPLARNILWESQPLQNNTENTWNAISVRFKLNPEFLKPENTINVYIWNKSLEEFYVDDFVLTFDGVINSSSRLQQTSNTNFFYDFETPDAPGLTETTGIKTITSHSGTKAWDLSSGEEYGPSISRKISEIASDSLKRIRMSVWVYPLSDDPNFVFTVSIINSKGESIFWNGESSENNHFKKNQWSKTNVDFRLPAEKFSPNDNIVVNIWNKGRDKLIADDIEIVYGETADRKGISNNIDPKSIYEKRYVPLKNVPPFKKLFFEKQDINLSQLSSYTTNDQFISGDFDLSNNRDELICIKGNKAIMLSLDTETKSFKVVWEQIDSDAISWQDGTKCFAGDFNADGLTDILSADLKTGNWMLLNFAGGKWKPMQKGASPIPQKWLDEKHVSVTEVFTDNRADALILFNKSQSFMLSLNLKKNRFEESLVLIDKNDPPAIKDRDIFFTGNFDNDAENEFLQLNTDWRFDLKLLEFFQSSFTIAYTVDFKGYTKDYSPKYYETSKLVAGNFTDPNNTTLLVFNCNCADKNFDGFNCMKFDNLPYLPNTVNLYRPGNTHE